MAKPLKTRAWTEVVVYWECAYCGHSHDLGDVLFGDDAEESDCEKCGKTNLVEGPDAD